ncbi:serine-enriched protein [Trichonephila clavata]|uniref:Serine-enriched protein n=1 Tax=Trichonephila clavata TaxID=2740835 RepID=A0A8X6HZ38_TRICU|nr:serine-enriched protein [Trichonephila clavata]
MLQHQGSSNLGRSIFLYVYHCLHFIIFYSAEAMSEELAEAEETEDYSVFENKTGLAEDMKFLASMPELCDVTFLVGDTRDLCVRSRQF